MEDTYQHKISVAEKQVKELCTDVANILSSELYYTLDEVPEKIDKWPLEKKLEIIKKYEHIKKILNIKRAIDNDTKKTK